MGRLQLPFCRHRREHDALTFAAAQSARVVRAIVLQTKAVQTRFNTLIDLGAGQAQVLQPKRDLILDRGRKHLRLGVLQDHAGPFGQLPKRCLIGAQTAQPNLAVEFAVVEMGNESN